MFPEATKNQRGRFDGVFPEGLRQSGYSTIFHLDTRLDIVMLNDPIERSSSSGFRKRKVE
ncbi:MAG: hypothetical protein Q9201_001521 [Fulgogasparrea decipioides]